MHFKTCAHQIHQSPLNSEAQNYPFGRIKRTTWWWFQRKFNKFCYNFGGLFGWLNIYANMGHDHGSWITSHVQKGSYYWLDISKAEGFVPPPSVYEKFLYLLIVGRAMICYCTIWPAQRGVFLKCISKIYFLIVFLSWFVKCISQLYFSSIFPNRIYHVSKLYFSTVFLNCISELYFQFCTYW